VKKNPIPILQGTLDLMILRTLSTMGPQHAYGIASRLEQVSGNLLNLNQGTIHPAGAAWMDARLLGQDGEQPRSKVLRHHEGRLKGLEEETARWRQMSGVVEKLLAEEQ
jgi:PadR family transcriptional regulator PadR